MINPQNLVNRLTEEFEKIPGIIAFSLVGSQARETVYKATEYSDLEAYIITTDEAAEQVEQLLPSLVSQLGTVLFSFKHQIGFVTVYDDLFRLELPVIKQSQMDSVFSRPKTQVVKVLLDRTNGQLDKILAKRPETFDYKKIFSELVINFWYWQILGVQYFKKGEYYNTRSVLGIHASALVKLFELLNDPDILLLETNKRIEQFLTKEQQTQVRRITPAYDNKQIKVALKEVMEVFTVIARSVKEKYGYEYDENLEEKVKPKLLELMNSS